MVAVVKKAGFIVMMGAVLASCGQTKRKNQSSPPDISMGAKITRKLSNGDEIVSNLVGTCRQDLGEGRQRLIGIYRSSLDPSVGQIDIQDAKVKKSDSGWSASWVLQDSAEALKIEDVDGTLIVTTTSASKAVGQLLSKLDLSPAGTVIVKLGPRGGAQGDFLTTPVTLKGYVEGEVLCKRG